ncbi:MAG TPA: flagellar biosynthesis anti-sigma factor FlgM [Terriglobales bacterium]|nr:flagellar biosynthesis anti-sigma factor FlgM [Terriglobales bacterium]
MRIDLNTTVGQAPEAAESANSRLRSASAPVGNEAPSDVARFSPDYVRVQTLAAAVGQLPEVRQDKVSALSEAVRGGLYAVTSEQTAAALVSHMLGVA